MIVRGDRSQGRIDACTGVQTPLFSHVQSERAIVHERILSAAAIA